MRSPWCLGFFISKDVTKLKLTHIGNFNISETFHDYETTCYRLMIRYKDQNDLYLRYCDLTDDEKQTYLKPQLLSYAHYRQLLCILKLYYLIQHNNCVTSYPQLFALFLLIKKISPEQNDLHFNFHIGDNDECSWSDIFDHLKLQKQSHVDAPLFLGIDQIIKKWPQLTLTKRKQEILLDFKQFYLKYFATLESTANIQLIKTLLGPAQLVEHWAEKFIQRYRVNPFSILSLQRYSGAFRFFNPNMCNSMQLFYNFIGEEKISARLHSLLTNTEINRELELKKLV